MSSVKRDEGAIKKIRWTDSAMRNAGTYDQSSHTHLLQYRASKKSPLLIILVILAPVIDSRMKM